MKYIVLCSLVTVGCMMIEHESVTVHESHLGTCKDTTVVEQKKDTLKCDTLFDAVLGDYRFNCPDPKPPGVPK